MTRETALSIHLALLAISITLAISNSQKVCPNKIIPPPFLLFAKCEMYFQDFNSTWQFSHVKIEDENMPNVNYRFSSQKNNIVSSKAKVNHSKQLLGVELNHYRNSAFEEKDLLECLDFPNKRNQHAVPEFKFYIYDLHPKFNHDLQACMSQVRAYTNLRHCGTGDEMYATKNMTAYETWQFALEVILHHKLMFSPQRTLNPREADAFYIPFYSGVACFCDRFNIEKLRSGLLEDQLATYLMNSTYYRRGIPHFMALSKIQREHADPNCRFFYHQEFSNITFVGIERERNFENLMMAGSIYKPRIPLVVAPYPSYGYLNPNHNGEYLKFLRESPRNTLAFYAASRHPKNNVRKKLIEQFRSHSTSDSNGEYFTKNPGNKNATKVWLITPEYKGEHQRYTLDWMTQSHFCLQPKGDSPTRKSFYDSIISGCIPVIFTDGRHVPYPFERHIDYSSFVVSIDEWFILNDGDIVDRLSEISVEERQQRLDAMLTYAEKLQYSFPISDQPHEDAVKYILDEVAYSNEYYSDKKHDT